MTKRYIDTFEAAKEEAYTRYYKDIETQSTGRALRTIDALADEIRDKRARRDES